MTNNYEYLRGATHTFSDGVKLRVIDLKFRQTDFWVTYETVYPKALSKRTTLEASKFVDEFGHLFQQG